MGKGGGTSLNGYSGPLGGGGPIYLDYNATTPLDPEVKAAMSQAMEVFGNPSSGHVYGQQARAVLDSARNSVAALIGCFPDEVFFTSGGTESINWAIKGAAEALHARGNHIIISAVEHPAVNEVAEYLASDAGGSFEVTRVRVNAEGIVDVQEVMGAVRDSTTLISIMLANNEVGSLQPIQEISQRLKGQPVALHTDASQAIGKVKVDWEALEVDLLTVAAHKFYGPKGVGALIVRRETPLSKFMHGAGQEKGQRAGTESTILVAGMGKACDVAKKHLTANIMRMEAMRERLIEQIESEKEKAGFGYVGTRINGPTDRTKRLPNTLSLSFENTDGSRLMAALTKEVACSSGAACHDSDPSAASDVLTAMNVPKSFASCTLRLSVGKDTTEEEVDTAASAVIKALRQAKSFFRLF